MNGAYWCGHMTIGGLPSPHSLIGFLRYFRNVSQRWPVSWMAPTCSICQEMVSIYRIKIKITTKFFKFIYFWVRYKIVKLQTCSLFNSCAIATFRFSLLSKSVLISTIFSENFLEICDSSTFQSAIYIVELQICNSLHS